MISLKELLTSTPLADGHRMFRNVTALAKTIWSNEGFNRQQNYKNIESLRSTLNQVLNGRRSCPSDLRDIISQIVKLRVEQEPDSQHWLIMMNQAFDDLESIRYLPGTPIDNSVGSAHYSEIVRFAVRSRSKLYIVPNVRETANAPHGKLFRQHFIASIANDEKNKSSLHVLVSSKEEAFILWQMFFVELRAYCEEAEANRKLSEAEDVAYIRVYAVDPRLCLSSVYIFNPDDLNHDMAAYHAYWQEDDQMWLSIIPIPRPFLRPFSDLYYRLLAEAAEKLSDDAKDAKQSNSDIIVAIISFRIYADQIISEARPLLPDSDDG